ncbi:MULTISPECIES: hypothetical protein [unclassified Enterococcus]|uniref:hypothetical protein n=1 Tax=unclassified Enterococcus TaxID=2608891 RepID=UPI0013EA40B7|nr:MULTISPECIES: hypothetical protein [unclassified Enterococcus]
MGKSINAENEALMQQIMKLTYDEKWEEDEKVVTEVTRLGKKLWAQTKDNRRSAKIIGVYWKEKIIAKGTSKEIAGVVDYTPGTVNTFARTKRNDPKGRQYRYLEL